MIALMVSLALASHAELLSYPGATLSGTVRGSDDRECRIVLWEGMAPYLPLLSESEQKQLAAVLKAVEEGWFEDESWPRRAALLRPYPHMLFDRAKEFPFQRRSVTYQQFALTCGPDMVRGSLAFLPPKGAGGLLLLKHASQPEYLLLVDVNPGAQAQMEELSAFVARYRADLEEAESPEDLPRGVQKEFAVLQGRVADGDPKRVQFWDVNGMLLPSCPGTCPEGTLSYALAHLSAETRRAFDVALGLVAARRTPGESEPGPGGRLVRFLDAWPPELGENPFLAAREEVKSLHREVLTFAAPEAGLTEELWGRRTVLLPTFDGDLSGTIKRIKRSF
ncbi:MAG: hypothetical protein ACOY3Y_21130 [Acidobacteriota bacterium]